MDGDSWEELGHEDVKKCDLVIWVILLLKKINVCVTFRKQASRHAFCLRSKPNFGPQPQPVYIVS